VLVETLNPAQSTSVKVMENLSQGSGKGKVLDFSSERVGTLVKSWPVSFTNRYSRSLKVTDSCTD